jgi:hypothetical protein
MPANAVCKTVKLLYRPFDRSVRVFSCENKIPADGAPIFAAAMPSLTKRSSTIAGGLLSAQVRRSLDMNDSPLFARKQTSLIHRNWT